MVQTRASIRKRKLPAQQNEASKTTKIRRRKPCPDGKSYFEWLPKDAIHNIIRFTSERPRHAIWQAHVIPEVALTLLKSHAVLSSSCTELFRSLEAREVGFFNAPEPTPSLKVFGRGNCSRLLFASLLSKLRQTVTEVKIMRAVFPVHWTRALRPTFPQLKSLSITFHNRTCKLPLLEILSAQGKGLEAFTLARACLLQDEVDAIAGCCKGLKTFVLQVWETEADIGKIWKSIGGSLEEVSIRNPYQMIDFDIPSIMMNCKKIEKLTAFCIVGTFRPERHDELEALCQNLGGQLKYLILDGCNINPVRLGRIVAACKNVAMDLKERDDCTSSSLIEIGCRASRVNIGPDDREELRYDNESLALAGARCKNLVGVTMRGSMPEACFRAFFAEPKLMLAEFTGHDFNLPNGGYVFHVLASKVSSLQTFEYSGTLPAASVLLQFIEANPLLETVTLSVVRASCYCKRTGRDNYNADLGPRFDLGMAAKIFLTCKRLITLSIRCYNWYAVLHDNDERRMEDHGATCLCARRRNIEVTICGHLY